MPSIYKLSTEAPAPGGGGQSRRTCGRSRRATRSTNRNAQTCHGADLRGSGNYPSLVDITARMGPESLKETIVGGRPAMPSFNELSPVGARCARGISRQSRLRRLCAAEARARARPRHRRAVLSSRPAEHPEVASVPPGRAGGMVGPAYPPDVKVPEVRMYTGYGMDGTIVKPPYSTLTAYDLNTGAIKWQVPAGGDDARATAQGAQEHRLHQSANRHRDNLERVAVPRRRRRQAARVRLRQRPGSVDRRRCLPAPVAFRRCTR